MSTMIMNMSQGNIERDESVTDQYEDEVMRSGCYPALAMTQLVPEKIHSRFPAELANMDMELFMQKMHWLKKFRLFDKFSRSNLLIICLHNRRGSYCG